MSMNSPKPIVGRFLLDGDDGFALSPAHPLTPSTTHRKPRPRSLVHRGVVTAAGLLFPHDLLPVQEAQRRILELWTIGSTVYRTPVGLLIVFPIPRSLVCELAQGAPVISRVGLLLAAPLTDREIVATHSEAGALLVCQAGLAIAIPKHKMEPVDPSVWLDVNAWMTLDVVGLGPAPAAPVLVTEAAQFSAREQLAGLPAPASQHTEAVAALRRALTGGAPADADGGGISHAAGRALQSLARLLKQRPPSETGQLGAKSDGRALGVAPALPTPTGASLRDRLADRLNDIAARMLLASGMAGMMGRKQAEYMHRMMRMFEEGMLDDALKHAIGLSEIERIDNRPPSLRTPSPRADLTISAVKVPARSSLNTDGELFAQLREMYRKAFDKLVAEGRIDEAAFVLAELLNANEEAVAFLEKHGRVKLAAEMAEGRNLPPGLVVRLWFLAGDRERAAKLAWKSGAFADAVDRMQRVDPERAREMRLFWAAELATAGAYASAVSALWPDRELREHSRQWIDLALEVGGAVGGRMLAYKLALGGAEDEIARQVAAALLSDEIRETAQYRQAFLSELVSLEVIAKARPLYRLAARTALRDAGAGNYTLAKPHFDRIVKLSEDGALRTDLPALPAHGRIDLSNLQEPLALTIAGHDQGAVPIFDAVLMPGGRTLLALGEAGVRLIANDGRTIVQWDHPANRLVVSDEGDRVIALVKRGETWRMTRIDLVSRRAVPWRDAAFQAFAADFDGALWFVATDSALIALDASAESLDALWREPKLEGRVFSICRSKAHFSILMLLTSQKDEWGRKTEPSVSLERRTYSLPSIVLRDRNELATPAPSAGVTGFAMTIAPEGQSVFVSVSAVIPPPYGVIGSGEEAHCLLTATDPRKGTLFEELAPAGSETMPAALSESWAVLSARSHQGINCRVLDRKDWRVRARFSLERATKISTRILGPRATFADDLGRLIALDLDSGEILRNLRVR